MKTMVLDAEFFHYATRFAATEKSNRPNISAVQIIAQPEKSRVLLASTDGRRFTLFKDVTPYNWVAEEENGAFTILLKNSPELAKVCRPGRHLKHLHVQESGEVHVSENGKIIYRSPESFKVDELFPDYRNVLPTKIDLEAVTVKRVCFHVPYLMDYVFRDVQPEIHFCGNQSDILVITNSEIPGMIGILMPIWITDEVPDLSRWIEQEETKEVEES